MDTNNLANKTALVVGCGGLGGYVIELLARYGLKNMVLIDGDIFSESNLNRQLMATKDSIGLPKVEVCKKRVEQISSAKVTAICQMFCQSNAEIVKNVDIVIDCVDNIKSRILLADMCERHQKILVHGAVSGNFGQAMICSPSKKTLQQLYENKNQTIAVTNSYTVATVASVQANLAIKAMQSMGENFYNQLFLINLDDITIKKLSL